MSMKEFDELDDMIEQTDASFDDPEFDSDLVPEEGFIEKICPFRETGPCGRR